jgi:hypothetical protein
MPAPSLRPVRARAWIELPESAGWGEVRLVLAGLGRLGYRAEEIRGDRVWVRVAGCELGVEELWTMPPG